MTILADQRGLVFHKGFFKRLLMPGTHWVSPFDSVEICDATEWFLPKGAPLEVLIACEDVKEELEVVEVPDNHLSIHRADGNVVNVLGVGKTCYWKGIKKHEFTLVNLDEPESASALGRSMLSHFFVRAYVQNFAVEAWEKGLLCIDNAFVRVLGSGNYDFWKGPRTVTVAKVDMRQQQLEVTGQEIMSRDKVQLRLNFFCQYRIVDPMKAGLEIRDFEKQLHVFLQLALREYVGSLTLDEILAKKEEIGNYVGGVLKAQALSFGIEIGQSGIKDVILPGDIREIMNQVLVAEKKAQANVIMRREETASTRSLLNTAKLMEDNAVLMRLKELEYVERISERVSQITLSGNGEMLDQLRKLFLPAGTA